MFLRRIMLPMFLLVLLINPANEQISRHEITNSSFRLPVQPGVTLKVTQGNNQGDHIAGNGSEYAFDFIVGQTNFVITAAQSGTIIGMRNDSHIQCDGLNHEVSPQQTPLSQCWTYANYVLIAHDDGSTAALYVHLLPAGSQPNMPAISIGEHVSQGQPVGLAGTTGWSTGVHLHFQVEAIPSSTARQTQSPGWWWTNSLPTTFSNPEVLAQDPNGVPQTGQSFLISGSPAVPSPTTVPMPPTQTSCPAPGTARAAILEPLALGSHQNIVYIDNEGTSSGPLSAMLKRYDVTTGRTTTILTLPSATIFQAQVSTDGQWILLDSALDNQDTIQLVRMDGNGLQTLYCTPTQAFSDMQWSPDQSTIAIATITNGNNNSPTPSTNILLLTIQNGQLRIPAIFQGPFSGCCVQLNWLDSSHLAIMGSSGTTDMPFNSDPVLLDISIPATQVGDQLKSLFKQSVPPAGQDSFGGPCYDFVRSADQTQIFVSQCTLSRYFPMANEAIVEQGPGSISTEPVSGGPLQTIYSNPAFAIAGLQLVSPTRLIFYVNNASTQPGVNVDTSQNGLWAINTDGTGLTHLNSATADDTPYFSIQFPPANWLVLSRDGTMYASSSSDDNSGNQTLFFGSLNGGPPTTFLSQQLTRSSSGLLDGSITVVGWTAL